MCIFACITSTLGRYFRITMSLLLINSAILTHNFLLQCQYAFITSYYIRISSGNVQITHILLGITVSLLLINTPLHCHYAFITSNYSRIILKL
jgi:hypothetical protein